MLGHAKRLAVIGRHDFINAIAEDKTAVKHGNLSVGQADILAVYINNTVIIDIRDHLLCLEHIFNNKGLLEHQANLVVDASEKARLRNILKNIERIAAQYLAVERERHHTHFFAFLQGSQSEE